MTIKPDHFLVFIIIVLSFAITTCAAPVASSTNPIEETQTLAAPTVATPSPREAVTSTASEIAAAEFAEQTTPTLAVAATATPDVRLDPVNWKEWPVIPTISARALEIYQTGLKNGNDPHHFSKIGDCQNVTSYFLADFDRGRYRLGEKYAYLQEVIDYYQGSWERESMAVKGGYNVATVFNPLFANVDFCEKNETPLACEFRLYQPSVVLISMETWWNHDDPTKYEFYMRHLLDEVIAYGALPVIATKADNLEGGHIINQSIAQLAHEYDIPMWNFWAAADPLPEHGLHEDGFHLTLGLGNYFDDPENTAGAWTIRNLTALETMNAVYQAVKENN